MCEHFQTGLRYAWGSQALKPLSKEVQCPPLQPGQSGKICVLLEIPSKVLIFYS